MKTTLLLLLSVTLMSCCDCDCPEETTSETIESAALSSAVHEQHSTESDSAKAETLPDKAESPQPIEVATTDNASPKKVKTVESDPRPSNSKPNETSFDNPFGSGSGNGDGDGFGSGTGTGDFGGASGDSPIRKRISDPDLSGIQSETDATITLRLTIDGAGNIMDASNIKSKTTTTDQSVINQVIATVKDQVKYSRNIDSRLVYEVYTVKINANN